MITYSIPLAYMCLNGVQASSDCGSHDPLWDPHSNPSTHFGTHLTTLNPSWDNQRTYPLNRNDYPRPIPLTELTALSGDSAILHPSWDNQQTYPSDWNDCPRPISPHPTPNRINSLTQRLSNPRPILGQSVDISTQLKWLSSTHPLNQIDCLI